MSFHWNIGWISLLYTISRHHILDQHAQQRNQPAAAIGERKLLVGLVLGKIVSEGAGMDSSAEMNGCA
jgi:hypothetical protein